MFIESHKSYPGVTQINFTSLTYCIKPQATEEGISSIPNKHALTSGFRNPHTGKFCSSLDFLSELLQGASISSLLFSINVQAA